VGPRPVLEQRVLAVTVNPKRSAAVPPALSAEFGRPAWFPSESTAAVHEEHV
jgi:hypothetical protein